MERRPQRNWYSISVASVQRFFSLVALVGVLGFAFYSWMRWDVLSLESRAEKAIAEANERIAQLKERDDFEQVKNDYGAAWGLLSEAQVAFDEKNFARAKDQGERCLIVLDNIEREGRGSIRVLSSHGNVEYRRGERGSWKRLRSHDTLNPGDWIKTPTDGTAELLFGDGTEFTLRQSTMVLLGGTTGGLGGEDKTTDIAFGRVELNTSESDRTVTTPKSSARVRGSSEALVAFDRDRGSGRFAAFSGELEVSSNADGQTRRIGALQQVEQLGDKLSAIKALPAKPEIASPVDDYAIDLARQSEVTLDWEPVAKARRYELRISNSRLFAANFIENKRTKTSARVGVRGEGNFYWQVAALDAGGARGPWSDTRSFRVATKAIGEVKDKDPPDLEIVSTETYGNIVIISGVTELGASVTINGDTVFLKSDGSFRSTLQMKQAGWNVLEISSTDAWKNTATERLRIFIDAL